LIFFILQEFKRFTTAKLDKEQRLTAFTVQLVWQCRPASVVIASVERGYAVRQVCTMSGIWGSLYQQMLKQKGRAKCPASVACPRPPVQPVRPGPQLKE
jgi:hypothetical protein